MKLENVNHIAIIGKGMIGISLAVLFTGNGYKTTVLAKELKIGKDRYDEYYKDLIANNLVTPKQADTCSNYLYFTETYADLADADIIFECVVERIDVKHAVYQEIEKHCKQFKVIASTTSAISVDDLAEGIIQKEKILVAHPWNPPHLVPCVEVVKGKSTSEEALQVIVKTLESVGREVSVMMKDAPGFIGNRLQHALYREAVYMVEQGIATPQDIDKALKSSFIPRYTSIGLFEHFDYAGLDMIVNIEDYLFPTLCNAKKTQDYIRTKYEAGDLGYKTGKGVYHWNEKNIDDFRQKASAPYLKFFNWSLPEK